MSLQSESDDQANSGLYSFLKKPHMYSFFQRLMGSHSKYRTYISEFMKPWDGARMLDIGCGTADILYFLPSNIDYVGYDISMDYINYAENKYGNRAKFHNERVNTMTVTDNERFDIVLADGLIHHLNNDEAKKLFQIGYGVLNDGGFMLTVDPTFVEEQRIVDKYLTSIDRGKHVRTPEEFIAIALDVFPRVEMNVILFKMLFSLSGCILKCYRH